MINHLRPRTQIEVFIYDITLVYRHIFFVKKYSKLKCFTSLCYYVSCISISLSFYLSPYQQMRSLNTEL